MKINFNLQPLANQLYNKAESAYNTATKKAAKFAQERPRAFLNTHFITSVSVIGLEAGYSYFNNPCILDTNRDSLTTCVAATFPVAITIQGLFVASMLLLAGAKNRVANHQEKLILSIKDHVENEKNSNPAESVILPMTLPFDQLRKAAPLADSSDSEIYEIAVKHLLKQKNLSEAEQK